MKLQLKLLSALTPDDLEDYINKWLKENKLAKIQKIKHSHLTMSDADDEDETVTEFYVWIYYVIK